MVIVMINYSFIEKVTASHPVDSEVVAKTNTLLLIGHYVSLSEPPYMGEISTRLRLSFQ